MIEAARVGKQVTARRASPEKGIIAVIIDLGGPRHCS